jgi:hypothetical protein
MIVTGAGQGAGPHVLARRADNLAIVYSFYAYPSNFSGGVRVATGDVNNDGWDDIITGAGPGGGPHVEVFSGKTGLIMASFYAYGASFSGGVFVAAGDVNGDGKADVITGPDAGGGPHLKVFDGTKLSSPNINDAILASFMAYDPGFTGGLRVAAGDFNDDNKFDVITGAGPGGGPHVRIFDGTKLTLPNINSAQLGGFMAYNNFNGGVYVAGDQGGEPFVYTGAGAGGGRHVRVLDQNGGEQLGFIAGPGPQGAIPAVGDSTGPASDLFLVTRANGNPAVEAFDFETGELIDAFPAYNAAIGVFSAVGVL